MFHKHEMRQNYAAIWFEMSLIQKEFESKTKRFR